MDPVKRRHWTPEEHEYLTERYGDYPAQDIAAHLGRSVTSVYNRANLYRLGHDRPHDVLTLNQCLLILGQHGRHGDYIGPTGIIARGLLRARKGTRHGRRPTWWVREADLIAYLRAYPQYIDKAKVEPAYRQYVSERYITLAEAFRRGAAYPLSLEHAVKAGCIPEALNHGRKGSQWVIPESILPRLIEGRRRFVTDAEHRRLVLMRSRSQRRQNLKRQTARLSSAYVQAARIA